MPSNCDIVHAMMGHRQYVFFLYIVRQMMCGRLLSPALLWMSGEKSWRFYRTMPKGTIPTIPGNAKPYIFDFQEGVPSCLRPILPEELWSMMGMPLVDTHHPWDIRCVLSSLSYPQLAHLAGSAFHQPTACAALYASIITWAASDASLPA